jgi:hypothetical protein
MEERFQKRMRFSFGHEVGHFVLHKNVYGGIPLSNPENWKELVLNMPEREYRNFEWQANEFAGRLLVPRERLVEEVDKIYVTIKETDLLPYLRDDPSAVLSRVSPGSKGSADLKATFPSGTKWNVQAKSTRSSKPEQPSGHDLGRLKQSSTKTRATPVIANVTQSGIEFKSASSGRTLKPPTKKR